MAGLAPMPLFLEPPPPKKKRKRYTAQYKLKVITYANNHTPGKAKHEFGVDANLIRRWRQQGSRDRIMAACPKKKKCHRRNSMALPTGKPVKYRTALPADLECALYDEIMAYRSDRIPINGMFVQTLALARAESHGIDISEDNPEAFKASKGWLHRFKKRFGLTTRTGTRRKMTAVSEDSVRLFYRTTQKLRRLVRTGRYQYIINIDEVPIYYDVSYKKTLDKKGASEVLIADGGDSKKRITAVFGIISSLMPAEFMDNPVSARCKSMYVLKGVPTSSRVIHKITTMDDVELRQNKKAYMNSGLFIEYLEKCIPTELRGKTILTFDNFRGHATADVVAKIQELGFAHLELPPNSTWAIQPLDVAINRPVKEGTRNEYCDEYVRRHDDPDIKGPWKVCHNWIVTTTQKHFRLAATREHVDTAFRTCGLSAGPEDCSDLTAENTYWVRLASLRTSLERYRKELVEEKSQLTETALFVDESTYTPKPDIILSVHATPDAPADERLKRRPLEALFDGTISEPLDESPILDSLYNQLVDDSFLGLFSAGDSPFVL